jgi:PKD repeat protein
MQTPNGCLSAKKQIIIKVQHITPDSPAFQNTFYSFGQQLFPTCSNSSATINVKLPSSTYIYNWYDISGTGSIVHTGSTYTLPNIDYNTVYEFRVAANDGFCVSSKTDVLIQPIKTPGLPKITTAITTICIGETLTLIAQKDTSTHPGGVFYNRWYNASNQLLHTGDTLIVPNIQNTSTFYCATVDSIPYNYYPGLGPYLCEGPRVSRLITVENPPLPVVAYTNPICIYNPTSLTVSNGAGHTIKWYNSSGTLIYIGNPFTYTNVNTTDTIYCQLTSVNGCLSVKKLVIINVQHTLPTSPTFQNVYTQSNISYFPTCSNSSATINVKLPNGAYFYNWYDASTAGNIVNVGSSYALSNINYNTVYRLWVATNDGTCIGNRTEVKVKPIKTPGLPKIISVQTKICQRDTLTLIAQKDTSTHPGGVFYNRWYNASNQLLHTGDTLIVPNIQNTSTYYCATVDSIPYNYYPGLGSYLCEGQKSSKLITVDTVTNPIVNVPTVVCKGKNVPLTVSNVTSASINWYNVNGTLLLTGVTYTIPSIQNSEIVLTRALGMNSCKSKIVQTIVIPQTPLANFTSTKTILNSGDITQFNNSSTGASKWAWDFGDGSTSTSQNPFHYFYNTGYYNVILIATSSNGCTDTSKKSNFIQVLGGNGINEYSIFNEVKLFPNPFTEGVWIDIPSSLNTVNVLLKNIVGQQLRQYKVSGKEFISLNELSAGMYILQINKDNETLNIKIIKE